MAKCFPMRRLMRALCSDEEPLPSQRRLGEAVLAARSPRLTEIAAKTPGKATPLTSGSNASCSRQTWPRPLRGASFPLPLPLGEGPGGRGGAVPPRESPSAAGSIASRAMRRAKTAFCRGRSPRHTRRGGL